MLEIICYWVIRLHQRPLSYPYWAYRAGGLVWQIIILVWNLVINYVMRTFKHYGWSRKVDTDFRHLFHRKFCVARLSRRNGYNIVNIYTRLSLKVRGRTKQAMTFWTPLRNAYFIGYMINVKGKDENRCPP